MGYKETSDIGRLRIGWVVNESVGVDDGAWNLVGPMRVALLQRD